MNSANQGFEDIFESSENLSVKYQFNIINILNSSVYPFASDSLNPLPATTLQIIPFVECKKNGQILLQFTIIDSANSYNSTLITARISANQKDHSESLENDILNINAPFEFSNSSQLSPSSFSIIDSPSVLSQQNNQKEMYDWKCEDNFETISKKLIKHNYKQQSKLTSCQNYPNQKLSFKPYKQRKISETPSQLSTAKEEYSSPLLNNHQIHQDTSTNDNVCFQIDQETDLLQKTRIQNIRTKRKNLIPENCIKEGDPMETSEQHATKEISKLEDDINKKGNAVNMAKNILKGFMEYIFVSAKEQDIVECCSKKGISIIDEEDNENFGVESNPVILNKQFEVENEINSNLISEKVEQIRKRFRKQYNQKMLEKPSNSKLLKFFANPNYGRLFSHYFSSEEIIRYISSSNIQNKCAHIDLINKIRSTEFDIEKLQDVLKTRIFKRPPFQKPSK